jgi:haloacid dehalogenase superfamily, subfamily IA, variant 1 with third motif having Dx(3-4)D or Dx(3-4)E
MGLPNKRPKVILLDLDDTLTSFDSVCGPARIKCCEEFVQGNPVSFNSEELYKSISDTNDLYWADPKRHKKGRENLKDARREVLRLALKALNTENEGWARKIADRYSELHNSMISLLPGAGEALELLRSLGIRLAVVTNGAYEGQREKLRRFDIGRYFEKILIDTEIGYSKPDIRFFQYALNELDVEAPDVWTAGDNLEWDVMGPQQLGIFAVWNDYMKTGLPGACGITPDLIVNSIYEMAVIISGI